MAQLKQVLAYLFRQASPGALYLTGALNGLLPCGLVYLALAGALSAPGLGGAAGYMMLFGLGTLPLMFGLSLTGRLVPMLWRTRMRQAVPYVASLMAVLFIVRGLGLGIPYLSPQLRAPTVQAVQPQLTPTGQTSETAESLNETPEQLAPTSITIKAIGGGLLDGELAIMFVNDELNAHLVHGQRATERAGAA
ncbi:sulfite exporter TauE/SafE family protein, partial [Hymenobacter cavernae]|uniref:sulfite exporter TauE/SafE family protein n=1 Tax=Hymenobacter cavernae TaxID=2044852 RepID=UPI001E3275EE